MRRNPMIPIWRLIDHIDHIYTNTLTACDCNRSWWLWEGLAAYVRFYLTEERIRLVDQLINLKETTGLTTLHFRDNCNLQRKIRIILKIDNRSTHGLDYPIDYYWSLHSFQCFKCEFKCIEVSTHTWAYGYMVQRKSEACLSIDRPSSIDSQLGGTIERMHPYIQKCKMNRLCPCVRVHTSA